jgi:hypothetical protein
LSTGVVVGAFGPGAVPAIVSGGADVNVTGIDVADSLNAESVGVPAGVVAAGHRWAIRGAMDERNITPNMAMPA